MLLALVVVRHRPRFVFEFAIGLGQLQVHVCGERVAGHPL